MAKTYIKDAGTQRLVDKLFVKDAGVWRDIKKVYVKDGGTWRLVFDPIPPTPTYNQNVIELNANSLYQWLKDCSIRPQHLSFGWTQTHPADAQKAVDNLTHFAVIVARRRERNRSGHITVIIPQQLHPNHNKSPKPNTPIQSEAGSVNRQITHNNLWYERNIYDAYGAFICPLQQNATLK